MPPPENRIAPAKPALERGDSEAVSDRPLPPTTGAPLGHRRDAGPGWFPYALIAPAMITLVVVGLVPFLYTVYLSLHEIRHAQVGDFAGLANYRALLGNPRFWHSAGTSALFVLAAVPIEFGLGLAGALILNQGIRLRPVIIPVLFIPTMMAPVVVAILWKIMLAGSWGVISYNVIERFGILTETSVFASPSLALYALVLVDAWQWTPFMMLAFFAGLQSLPVTPYRAAAVDGATSFQTFRRLTLPLMAPLMAVIGLLRLIDAFKVFDTIFLLTGGGPGSATESTSLFVYKTVFDFWNLGPATATAVVIWIMFFVFANVFYQVARRKLRAF
jgi:multiple sugar transport system permease protein